MLLLLVVVRCIRCVAFSFGSCFVSLFLLYFLVLVKKQLASLGQNFFIS